MDYSSLNTLSQTILNEIDLLPGEFRGKSEELGNLQQELNELKSNLAKKENIFKKAKIEIENIENNLINNYDELNEAKSNQKIILFQIDEEAFELFKTNLYQLDEIYYKKILAFLKYENNYKEELNFLLIKTDDLFSLLKDSYNYFKSIENKEKYQEMKNKILSNKIGNNIKINFNQKNKINNKSALLKPFDIIFNFIENTFKIIDITNKIKEIKSGLNNKKENQEKLYIEIQLLKNNIANKQEQFNNINIYIKKINNILVKYKNFFGTNKNSMKFQNNDLINKDNNENNNNNMNKKIAFLKNNNNNILINNNKIINSNLNNYENNSNNFYHAVNNCSTNNNKTSKSNSSLDNSSSNISPNNIKIISINTNSIPGNNIKNKNNQIPNTTKNPNIVNRNRVSLLKSNSNSNENKKIKIGPLPICPPSTSQKYKNKITKTNSYEKEDTKKILFSSVVPSSEQNKSYHKLDDDLFNDDIDGNNVEKKLPRTNNKFYSSLKLVGDNKMKNINKLKIIIDNNKNKNFEKITKEEYDKEKDKETIVDDYNNNILVEFKKNETNKNKKPINNLGIYNNKNKIIKINENNKFNSKK